MSHFRVEKPQKINNQIIAYLYLYPKGFSLLSVCFSILIFVVGQGPAYLRTYNSIKIIWPVPGKWLKKSLQSLLSWSPLIWQISYSVRATLTTGVSSRIKQSFLYFECWSFLLFASLVVNENSKRKWKRTSTECKLPFEGSLNLDPPSSPCKMYLLCCFIDNFVISLINWASCFRASVSVAWLHPKKAY